MSVNFIYLKIISITRVRQQRLRCESIRKIGTSCQLVYQINAFAAFFAHTVAVCFPLGIPLGEI